MDPSLPRPLACGALAAVALALSACSRPAPGTPAPPPSPPPAASVPVITPPAPQLRRAELLAAVDAPAAAAAAGSAYPKTAAALAGRRFALKLPFGCGGIERPDAALRYAYDADDRTLRMTARPEVWTKTPLAALVTGPETTEAVEGFWLRRPWLRTETCPPTGVPPSGAPSPETVGLAQVFVAGGSRLGRRGDRPYETTRKLEEGAPGSQGYRLVLEGRVAAGDGTPVRCRSAGPDQRPVCLVLVELDRVAFEDAAGALLAEWTS